MGVVAVVNPDEESGGGGTNSPKEPRRAGEASAGAATSTRGVLGELGKGAPSSRYSSSICRKGTLMHCPGFVRTILLTGRHCKIISTQI